VRPFNPNRFHWNYVYFWDYAGGMMTGWGVHHIDIIHWALQDDRPLTVATAGGTFAVDDHRETPDTLDAYWEYKTFTVQGSMYHGNARPIEGRSYGIAFYGSTGTLVIDRAGYTITPEGPNAVTQTFPGSEQEFAHATNFVQAIRGEKTTLCDLATGHRSSIPCTLSSIAYRTGRKLTWNADKERFDGDAAADRYLTREYRKPWILPG
jgi:predicted dehydrogenase